MVRLTASDHPQCAPGAHRLPSQDFISLASGLGAEECVDRLVAVEHSWRMVQLRVLLDQIRDRPDLTGPLSPLSQAWDLLTEAQTVANPVVGDLLRYPHIGTWASHTLRRLRGSAPRDSTPIWVDIGYLHALAAAAAIRANLRFDIRVPVRQGYVVLPTLGTARISSSEAWSTAQVSATTESVRISGQDTSVTVPQSAQKHHPGWLSATATRAIAGDHRLTVQLEFLDPYRDLRTPRAPDPPSPVQAQRWEELLRQAWRLLVRVCPDRAAPMARGLRSITPLPAVERFRTMSASAGDAFGALIVSEPPDPLELAVTLVHEFQHIKLGALLHLVRLQHEEPPHRLYAPWRDDPRPLSGLLQGVYAFVGVADFWRAYIPVATDRARLVAEFEFCRWQQQVRLVLQSLSHMEQLTDHGRRLITELHRTVEGWRVDGVRPDLEHAAARVVADHRARWRLHHLRPDPALVAALADAWLADEPRPSLDHPAPTLHADPDARLLDTQAALTLLKLTAPAEFSRLRSGGRIEPQIAGATTADVALTAGDIPTAHATYLADVAVNPERQGNWAGLRAVADAFGHAAAASALAAQPELVRAVFRRVSQLTGTPPEPLALAEWFGSGSATG